MIYDNNKSTHLLKAACEAMKECEHKADLFIDAMQRHKLTNVFFFRNTDLTELKAKASQLSLNECYGNIVLCMTVNDNYRGSALNPNFKLNGTARHSFDCNYVISHWGAVQRTSPNAIVEYIESEDLPKNLYDTVMATLDTVELVSYSRYTLPYDIYGHDHIIFDKDTVLQKYTQSDLKPVIRKRISKAMTYLRRLGWMAKLNNITHTRGKHSFYEKTNFDPCYRNDGVVMEIRIDMSAICNINTNPYGVPSKNSLPMALRKEDVDKIEEAFEQVTACLQKAGLLCMINKDPIYINEKTYRKTDCVIYDMTKEAETAEVLKGRLPMKG